MTTPIILVQTTIPATPTSGRARLFLDSSDRRVKVFDQAGRVHVLTPRQHPNLLANSSFDFAQRQDPATYTSYNSTLGRNYAADCWGLTNSTASVEYKRVPATTAEAGLLAPYYGQLKKTTNTGKVFLAQPLEARNSIALRGRWVTFECKMRLVTGTSAAAMRLGILSHTGTSDSIAANWISAHNAAGTDPTFPAGEVALAPTVVDNTTVSGLGLDCVVTTAWQRFGGVFFVPLTCNNLIPAVWSRDLLTVGDEVAIAECVLSEGYETGDWQPGDYANELAAVERRVQKSFPIGTNPATNVGANTGEWRWTAATAAATTARSPSFMFRTRMRAAPTPTFYNPAAANANARDLTGGTDTTAIAGTIVSDSSICLTCTGNAGTAVGNHIGVHITLVADL